MKATKQRDTLLIVDDEQINLSVLTQMLSFEYELLLAKSGDQALRIAASAQPDMILLDVLMPGMDGFETIKALKASPATAHIPVVFITGLDSTESEERGLMLGAADYITKPYNPIILKARVATHLRIVHHRYLADTLGALDPLTEIPNRFSFNLHLSVETGRSAREKCPLSLLLVDIDNFKAYNDTYSYTQGDRMLKAIANSIINTVQRATDLTVRIDADEFGVLLPNTDDRGAIKVAEKIRYSVENLIVPTFTNEKVSETVSIGVASDIFAPGKSTSLFVDRAREKMFLAKQFGGNRIVS